LLHPISRGLGEGGFVEGRNVTIEYRWALGQYDRLPAMAAELVSRPVTVLVSTGGEPATLVAKAATAIVPIVFATVSNATSISRSVLDRIDALLVTADPFFDTRRDKLVALAARHTVPTMYHLREFPAAGGLVSYGVNFVDAYRQVGVYTGRVLNGEKPADLPVMQASKFEFVINMKTAKALGLEVPLGLSAGADEVIE
jgi:ABC-type uncharacterized transport system substrate-binding protein